MRRDLRDDIAHKHLLERIVKDIQYLLLDYQVADVSYADVVDLWDEKKGAVQNGISYGKDEDVSLETGYGKIIEDKE